MSDSIDIRLLQRNLRPGELAELDRLLQSGPIWRPHPENIPQQRAFEMADKVDVLGFGGAAGGGKSDLGCGLALLKHQVCQVFRREGTELRGLIDRCEQIVGHNKGLGGKPATWKDPTPTTRMIEFGSTPHAGDESKYQGRAKDLLWLDEASNFLESQVRFLMGWVRSVDAKQHCLTLLTFNPPTSSDGRWIVAFFAPWLDDKHPNPAEDGEIRWFATIGRAEVEVPDDRAFVLDGQERVYDFDEAEYPAEEIIRPSSRTFIGSKVTDNPYLRDTGYLRVLMGMPEPLRSQMLHGDFKAGMRDSAYQVIPTAWVDAAMERWEKPRKRPVMDSVGVDVAMRGADDTVIATRSGHWFGELVYYPGEVCQTGGQVAGYVVAEVRDRAPIHIDSLGVGAEPYAHLAALQMQVHGVNFGDPAGGTTAGNIPYLNRRTKLWWMMREALDPANAEKTGIALPPDKRLRSELCAPLWKIQGRVLKVESREDIVKRIGKSPDAATAVILALIDVPKWDDISQMVTGGVRVPNAESGGEHDPYASL